MNEETNVELMDDDNFFDSADFEDEGSDGDHTEETDTEEIEAETEVESEVTETADADTEPVEQGEQSKENQPEMFELNYMGNVEQHTREEMIALAQMGKDRDRILQQRDALGQFRSQNEPILNDLFRIAKDYGMEPSALLSAFETNRHRREGKTEAEAEAIVAREKAERQLEAFNQQERQRQQQAMSDQKRQQDAQAFKKLYPTVDFKDIPDSVWNDVRNGDTLVNSYGRYECAQLKAENQRLQQQLVAKEQNDKNKQNAIGSMKSGSGARKPDPFDEGFESGW